MNKIVLENAQFNYFTDFGLANFAISNIKISKPSNSDGDLSERNIPCDDDLLTWKLISRNADSRLSKIGDECDLGISAFTEVNRPGLYDLIGMGKWKSFFD